jgi:hypothetical protein
MARALREVRRLLGHDLFPVQRRRLLAWARASGPLLRAEPHAEDGALGVVLVFADGSRRFLARESTAVRPAPPAPLVRLRRQEPPPAVVLDGHERERRDERTRTGSRTGFGRTASSRGPPRAEDDDPGGAREGDRRAVSLLPDWSPVERRPHQLSLFHAVRGR